MSPRRDGGLAFSESAPIFAALGDPTRLRIVARLCKRSLDEISRQWDVALDRLRQLVEDEQP
jgi:hypothetical protein